MTGFGQGTSERSGLRVTLQVRTVNNRFAEVRVRLPEDLAAFEADVRRKVLAQVRRGRVDLVVTLERTDGAPSPIAIDREAAAALLEEARRLGGELGLSGDLDLRTLLQVPGVVSASRGDRVAGDTGREAIECALDAALLQLDASRRREGEALRTDLLARVDRMRGLREAMTERAREIPGTLRDRLVDRVAALSQAVPVDPARLAQEAAILADRADVTEELVRLDGHLDQAASMLRDPGGEPVGKRMDFLLQEIQRETNTVCSKSADLDLTRRALDLKNEVERVREQIQNLE